MRRIVLMFGIVIVSVLFLETAYFSYVLTQENSDIRSDAILVFMGAEKRIETGYRLANQGLAPGIVLSPANDLLAWGKAEDGNPAFGGGFVFAESKGAYY